MAASPGDLYEELFIGHFSLLVRLARLLGADDPEDVVQDAFVSLHHKRDALRDPQAALAYLRSSVCKPQPQQASSPEDGPAPTRRTGPARRCDVR